MKKHLALLNPLLEAFMAVAKYQTVNAAARNIHLTQTAVTQRIISLEQKLQTTLFIRTKHGMKITQEGEKLLRYCQTVTDLSMQTFDELAGAGITSMQRVTISGPSSIMSSRIVPTCMKLSKKFPQLYLTFDINDTDDVIIGLRQGYSHFAVIKPQQVNQEMHSKELLPEKYLLVCSKKWATRSLSDILENERIIDFNEGDVMTFNYLQHYGLLDAANPNRLFVNRTDALQNMIVSGYGYGVLTEEFSQDLLKSGKLITLNQGHIYKNILHLAWYRRHESAKYLQDIIQSII